MASTHNFNQKIAAAVLGGALLTVTFAGAANAAPVGGIEDNPVSLTIHKSESQAAGSNTTPQPGGVAENIDAAPIQGVEFTVRQVTAYNGQAIDLTNSSGWAIVEQLKAQTLPLTGNVTYGTAYTSNTDAQGRAVFNNLDMGVYIAEETGNAGDSEIVSEAKPFLLTLPSLTGEAGDSDRTWNYDVNAYPKNSVTEITKTLDETGAYGLGDRVTWTVEADVPRAVPGDSVTGFRITDTLDERLEFVSGDVYAVGNDGSQITLADTDYTLTTSGATVTLNLTADGLARINGAEFNQGTTRAKIGVDLLTEVTALGDGFIENSAELLVNTPDNSKTIESDPVVSEWGGLVVLKHSGTDEAAVLEGAEFQIFSSEADALAKTNAIDINGVSTFTTEADGEAELAGLLAGNYWLVETKAPTGYIGQDAPIAVTVTPGAMTAAATQAVSNSPIDTPVLPPLGATGMVTLFALGGAAVVGGGVLAMRSRVTKAAK